MMMIKSDKGGSAKQKSTTETEATNHNMPLHDRNAGDGFFLSSQLDRDRKRACSGRDIRNQTIDLLKARRRLVSTKLRLADHNVKSHDLFSTLEFNRLDRLKAILAVDGWVGSIAAFEVASSALCIGASGHVLDTLASIAFAASCNFGSEVD
jgi:hypothetical protein